MPDSPLITVYITNYNYEKYIQKSIESVLNQTLQNFELIIIDDGSTDNSKEIIEQYAQHPAIKVIFQKNKGLNITNNIAMRVATGKYIMRLDADDYLDPNALLVMSNMLERDSQLGLVFPDYYMIDAEENILSVEKRHEFDKNVSVFDQPAHGACTMIRLNFLINLGGYDEEFSCQDGYELWIKFVARYKVSNVNTPLFYYRQHGGNLTTNENKILSTRTAIKEKFVKKNELEKLNTIAIIPVRGTKYSSKNIAFKKLNGRSVLDRKIDAALDAKKINYVIISSPDIDVEKYIQTVYSHHPKILFHKREKSLARLNTGLVGTVNSVLEMPKLTDFPIDLIMLLAIEYPFLTAEMINNSVNTLQIFDTDSLISVRPDTDKFFQHHGKGMKSILNLDQFSKLEREALFRYSGGLSLVKKQIFEKKQQIMTGLIGHIVIDQKSAHVIRTKLDMEIAEFLACN